MKRNVVLFSLLGIGVLYIFFGTEKERASTEKDHLESGTTYSDDYETTIYHTRKLLSFENTRNKLKVDSARTSHGNTLEDSNNAQIELLGKETSRNLGLRSRKLTRRRKRDVPYPEQQYAWKFNLNVTRRENNGTLNKLAYSIPSDEKTEDGHLGMAMSVSGNGPNQSVGDLYQAWDSVGQFLRTLFGGTFEELKDKGHDVSLDISPLPNGTLEVPQDLFIEGSGEDSQELRNRRGKFLLGIFGFGGNKENPPRDEGSGEIEIQEFINTESEVQELLLSTETLSKGETSSVLAIVSTENLKDSVTHSARLGKTFTEYELENAKFTSTNSNKEPFSVMNCTDCEFQTEPFVPTDATVLDEQNPTAQALVSSTIPEKISLSDETLKDFCIALFSRMRTSGRSMEQSEGSGNIENLISDETGASSLTDDPRTLNMGFFESIWKRIVGSRVDPVLEEPSKVSKRSRFIRFGNLFGGLSGSGRSVDLGETNLDLDEFNEDLNKIGDAEQFLTDCEEFLKSAHTETRPNIFDLVDPHPVESFTTEVTTLHSDKFQLEELDIEDLTKKIASHFESTTQKEVFPTVSTISKTNIEKQTSSYLNYDQLSTEYQNKQFEENKKITVSGATELVYTEAQYKVPSDPLSIQNLVMEKLTVTQELSKPTEHFDNSKPTNVPEMLLTTKSNINLNEDGSRNLFVIGSVADEVSSDNSNNESIFGGLMNFGSGEREIKEVDISTEERLDKTTESPKQRIFGLFNLFGSGERSIEEETLSTDQSFQKATVTNVPFSIGFGSDAGELVNLNGSDNEKSIDMFTATVTNEGRIFGFLGFGSGERDLSETSELPITTNEGRIFGFLGFGSGERDLSETSELSTTNEGRIFGFLGFGSGERDLPEISELATEKELLSLPTTKGLNTDRIPSLNMSEFSVEISEQRISSNANETEDERSFNINMFGSGGGRDFQNVLTDTEDVNCLDCFSEPNRAECAACAKITNPTDQGITPETSIIRNDIGSVNKLSMEDSTVGISNVGGMSSTDSLNDNKGKIPRNGLDDTTISQHSFPPKSEDSNTATEITLDSTTLLDKSRFLNTIFLTGSGEGGLFVDNKGPINLVQESEFTQPPVFQQPVQPRRGARRDARKHDSLDFQIPNEKVQVTQATPVQSTTENNFTDFQNTTDLSTLDTFVTAEADNETEIDLGLIEIDDENWKFTFDISTPTVESESPEVPVSTTSTSTTPNTPSETDTTTSMISTSPKIDTTTSVTIRTSPKISTTTSVTISTSPKIKPRSKYIEPSQRICTSASQCNRTLNERCISDGPTAMCKCGRSYIRSPETGKCEAPVMLTTSLKLPGEAYHDDLKNRNSERFQKMENDSIETMWILLGDDPEVFRLVAGVDVSGFEKGSLVVHWEITLAAPPNESVAALIQQVEAELKEAFEDEDLLKRAPLNVQDAVMVGVTNGINPCEKTELNYCSINANCIRDPTRGFKCHCKDDYEDKSTDKNHPGEICTATCPSYYCGDHGECKLKQSGEFHCSCNGWYFGERCEISGIVVIAGFASFNALLIIVVLLLVCYCRKRRYRQSQFYGQNQVRFQPESELGRFTASPRLVNAIAMDDIGSTKAPKYMAISTPMHNMPNIHLTSPSIIGSSVDYDYDSTFDRTPSVGEVNVEVHKSGSSPKV